MLDGEGATPSPASPLDVSVVAEGQLEAAPRLGIPEAVQGDISLDTQVSLTSFDDIAIEALALATGALDLSANGSVSPQTAGFDLSFDLDAQSPDTGFPIATNLLQGAVEASGRALRDPETQTLLLDDVSLRSDILSVALSGQGNAQTIDVDAEIALSDLSALSPQAEGALSLTANVSGPRTAPLLDLDATGDGVVLAGQAFARPRLTVDATLDPQAPAGDLAFTGTLGEEDVDVTARVETGEDGVRRLTDLDARIGTASLTGELTLPTDGAPTGTLALDAPDLSEIGPLVLTELAGSVSADIALGADETATLALEGEGIEAAGATIGTVTADLTVETWLSQPTPEGDAAIRDLLVGGLVVPRLDIAARQTAEDAFAATLEAEAEGLDLAAEANVLFQEEGTRIELSSLSIDGRGLDTELAGPAALVLGQDATRIERAVLSLDGGEVALEGLLAPRFDLALDISDVSLAIADGFAPDLALEGTVNGAARVTGASSDPEATFQLVVSDATAAPLQAQNAPPVTLDASGRYANGLVELAADLLAADGTPISFTNETLSVDALRARVTLAGEPATADWTAAVTADALEAAGVRAANVDLALDGQGLAISPDTPLLLDLAGSAALSGDPLPPVLTGVLDLDAAASIPALDNILVQRARVSVGDTALAVAGRVDATTPGFDLTVDGDASSPETGIAALDGLLRGDVDISGALQGDVAANTYRLGALSLTAPALAVTLDGTVEAETVDLTATGTLADLSSVSDQASGRIQLDASLTGARAAPAFEATVTGESVTLAGTRLIDPRLEASGTLDPEALAADLALTGQLGNQPVDVDLSLTTAEDGTRVLEGIDARIGRATLTGDLRLPPDGVPVGDVALDVPDLAAVAPLFLTSAGAASGSVTANVSLANANGEANAAIAATARAIVFGDTRVGSLDADLAVADYLGTPRPEGEARARDVVAAGLTFSAIDLDASQSAPGRFDVTLDADGSQVSLDAAAALTLAEGTTTVDLARASGSAYGIPVALRGPGRVVIGEETRLENIVLDLGGGSLAVSGTVAPTLDVSVDARALPLALADVAAPDLGLEGTLSGTASVTGTTADPNATFDLTGTGLSAAPLASVGLAPLEARASGQFQNQRLTFDAAVSGPLDIAADGSVDLSGPTPVLDVQVSGNASTDPLADRLARAGVRADADITFDVSITGPANDPTITGDIRADGATVGDAQGRFILRNVSADVSLTGDQVVINRIAGNVGPGTLVVTGTVGLQGDLPANIQIAIDEGRFADGTLVVARVDADLTLFGPLLGGPTLAGRVDLVRTLITLNDLPSGGLDPIEVRHVNAPADVLLQAQQLGIDAGEGSGSGGGSASGGAALFLDVTVATREPISVRGRGLNVDLAGDLQLLGPVSDIRAVGAFELVRGRLDLLGQRLTFDEARLDFTGDLDPTINFAATTNVDGYAVTLRLFGRATEPEIAITSVPDLPQDEALARLLFGRALSDLSPFQIARLAQGIQTLTGNPGPLSNALDTLGLDLDVDEEGNATVGIGRQINERTYVNVEQSTVGGSRVVIDLELTDEVKARGSFSSEGSTGLGVFFEREY